MLENKIISREVIKYILQSTPLLPVPLSDSVPEQEFQFQMDMDIWTRTPSATPHQPTKKLNAHFWITFNF